MKSFTDRTVRRTHTTWWPRPLTMLVVLFALALGTLPEAQAQSASATYTAGIIPTNDFSYSPACNGAATPLTVNIPPGALVTSVNVSYTMEALPPPGNGWVSEQRSRLFCQQTATGENGPRRAGSFHRSM